MTLTLSKLLDQEERELKIEKSVNIEVNWANKGVKASKKK